MKFGCAKKFGLNTGNTSPTTSAKQLTLHKFYLLLYIVVVTSRHNVGAFEVETSCKNVGSCEVVMSLQMLGNM